MFTVHTILYPTDFSAQSEHAFELACALARDYSARLVLLHVYPPPIYPVFEGGAFPVDCETPPRGAVTAKEANQPPNLNVERVLVEGDPAHEIVEAAKKYDAGLIVMGTHGRGGLTRLLMGSVAEVVNRKATCPVLTVRNKLSVNGTRAAETAHAEEAEEEMMPACPHALGR
jgi:nucleotide-binding universal stress UspA family protein